MWIEKVLGWKGSAIYKSSAVTYIISVNSKLNNDLLSQIKMSLNTLTLLFVWHSTSCVICLYFSYAICKIRGEKWHLHYIGPSNGVLLILGLLCKSEHCCNLSDQGIAVFSWILGFTCVWIGLYGYPSCCGGKFYPFLLIFWGSCFIRFWLLEFNPFNLMF